MGFYALARALEDFVMAKAVEGLTDASLRFYRENGQRILWFFQQQGFPDDVTLITSIHIRALLYYVKTAAKRWGVGSTSSRKPASASTIDAYWRTFQAFFSWLVGEGVIRKADNPMQRVPRPKRAQQIIKEIPLALFQAAMNLFPLQTLVHLRNRAILAFQLDTGARLIETFRINIENLHLAEGYAVVFGKGNVERVVGIGAAARAQIEAYLAVHPHPDSGPLWVSDDGTRLSRSGLQSFFKRLKTLGGGVRWSAHTFRSTWAVNLIRAGGDVFSLQTLGGWTDLEMPRHYTRALSVEDALRTHRRASPGDRFIANS
jgi:site-specific recombinase XerD